MAIVYLFAKFAQRFDKINIDFQLCYNHFGAQYSITSDDMLHTNKNGTD